MSGTDERKGFDMTTYQVVYGSETNGISCYGNDYLGYTYIVHIDGEEVAEVEGEENYADAAEIFDRMFFGDRDSYLDELDEVFQIQNDLKYPA